MFSGQLLYILTFLLTFLFKDAKLRIQKQNKTKQNKKQKKADPYFPLFWVSRKRANKHLFFRPYGGWWQIQQWQPF